MNKNNIKLKQKRRIERRDQKIKSVSNIPFSGVEVADKDIKAQIYQKLVTLKEQNHVK